MQIDTGEEICVYRDWVIRERGECQGEFSPKKKKKKTTRQQSVIHNVSLRIYLIVKINVSIRMGFLD